MSHSTSVVEQPPDTGASSLTRDKALVVGADYFALTSRVDPNVIFWSRKELVLGADFPKGVTHLWIAPDLREEAAHVVLEAHKRKVQVWNVVVGELRRRLLPFWTRNRSVIDPVEPQGEPGAKLRISVFSPPYTVKVSEEEILAADEAFQQRLHLLKEAYERVTIKRLSSRPLPRHKRSTKHKAEQKPLRLVERDVAPREEIAEQPTEQATTLISPTSTPTLTSEKLEGLPAFERKIVSMVYGLDDAGSHTLEEVAEEFGLPVANVQRVIARVRAKIGMD